MAQPTDRKGIPGLSEARTDLGPGSDDELGPADRVERLRLAVEEAGGAPVVARQSGIPLSTLKRFTEGQDPKFGAVIRLCQALDVRLEWLATGAGPMRAGQADPAYADAAPPALDLDSESLVAGLNIAETLQPDAPAEARARAALLAHEQLRRRHTPAHPPLQIDPDLFARCLEFAEQLLIQSGRLDRAPAHSRLRLALGAYRLTQEEMRSNRPEA